MYNLVLRVGWALVAANGAVILWIVRYGALWQYQPAYGLALRLGMAAVGIVSILYGLGALLGSTRLGDTLRDSVDVAVARRAPALWRWRHGVPLYEPAVWRWRKGKPEQEENDALSAPTGDIVYLFGEPTVEEYNWPPHGDCVGLALSEEPNDSCYTQRASTAADLLRAQAGRCAEAGFHDMAKELRTEADKLDDGCYTQGSDPVVRK